MKYLFAAKFKDGSVVNQTIEDISLVNPEKSAFFDVLNHPSELAEFSLCGDSKEIYLNFNSQTIHVNGVKIKHSTVLADLRLIYYRQVTLTFPQGLNEIQFNVGWQGNDENGKNHQQILTVL